MECLSSSVPRWPARLAEAAVALRGAGPRRESARAALWPVLHAALFASLRSQAGRVTWVTTEDLEDLASQKSLDLLLRVEEGSWDPGGRVEHEVAGYVARVARHALVDLARRRGRECTAPEDPEAWADAWVRRQETPPRPEDRLAAREFAEALGDCLGRLAPRARDAWFGRVFLERPSREIASVLGVTAPHVDVIVQRARAALRRCMEAKGLRADAAHPGALVELWSRLTPNEESVAARKLEAARE